MAEGLKHLHANGVYHCDVKPRNLIWTNDGVRIIDFNVSVTSQAESLRAGGSNRYIPPDFDKAGEPSTADLVDRDLFALGVTLYEVMTRNYPWDGTKPPPATEARNPAHFPICEDLAPELIALMLKSIAPWRVDRVASAAEFASALAAIKHVRRLPKKPELLPPTVPLPNLTGPAPRPNTNPFVWHLRTLYSQGAPGSTNAGTRGLDALGDALYVETALDHELLPEVMAGKCRLVVITGNAGDGKTAFLEKVKQKAREQGGQVTTRLNGSHIELGKRSFQVNYDGSQDEADKGNDEVLLDFFGPYSGETAAVWPSGQTRLIAINEGRLVDFLDANVAKFPRLARLVHRGLSGGDAEDGVVLVNLNLRSVVGDLRDATSTPLLDQILGRLTDSKHWHACEGCDLKEKCYARHNALTFQDPVSGPKVTERLRELFTLTHLRGRLHITLRDLRSALAFMLVGTRDCDEIHQAYAKGNQAAILDGFYFNSWRGGEEGSADRLLTLLRDVDVGQATDAKLDRGLDFVSPRRHLDTLSFDQRPGYDLDVLATVHRDLPREYKVQQQLGDRFETHRRYVGMARRRHYFERRDDGWREMWPYRAAGRMLEIIRGAQNVSGELPGVIQAINRGEGLIEPDRFGTALALQAHHRDRVTIRSYRVFPGKNFRLEVRGAGHMPRFVEHLPGGLVLSYEDDQIKDARLDLNLDVFEMLQRLGDGYLPSAEEMQGYYLSLTVFKNVLGSATYSEVLLSETGRDFYRVRRSDDGRLTMTHLAGVL